MPLESPLPALSALSASLSSLQKTLTPLLKHPSDQIVSKLEAGSSHTAEDSSTGLEGKLDAARLYVAIAYVLLDLAWIQLKIQGQDPSTHPVHAELERVRTYFGKIKLAQSGIGSASSSTHAAAPTLQGQQGRMRIDQAAVARFVKNGLGSAGEKGTHIKFDEEKEKSVADRVRSSSGSSSSSSSSTTSSSSSSSSSGEDDEVQQASSKPHSLPEKRDLKGRTIRDPFEGYDTPKRSKSKADPSTSSIKKRKAETPAMLEPTVVPLPLDPEGKRRQRKGKASRAKNS